MFMQFMENHDIDEKILAGFTFGSGREKKVSDPRMDEFVKRAGMKLLRDESVCIDQASISMEDQMLRK